VSFCALFSYDNSSIIIRQTSERPWYKDVSTKGASRKILPEKYRKMFRNKQIVCVEYQDITDSDEHEIFQVRLHAFHFSDFLLNSHIEGTAGHGTNACM
jgi:hypothetical protein